MPYEDAMKKFSEKIHSEDQKLRQKYYDLPKEFPKESLPPDGKVDRVFINKDIE